ncbi:MAG: hypothetical protein LJE97_10340 [Betaproteobacteria bacterium]|nr:hypothetical protein [Betaproteobacteria bacterium]
MRQKIQNVPTLFIPNVNAANPFAMDARGPAGRSLAGATWDGIMIGR